MSKTTEKIWANGFSFKKNPNSPDWVIGRISCKVDDAIETLKQHKNQGGWCNININIAKESNEPYMEIDTWQPKQKEPEEDLGF
jgi:hypothetical protein